jgi:hypothetical protein
MTKRPIELPRTANQPPQHIVDATRARAKAPVGDGRAPLMERPWFRAQSHNHLIGYILMEDTGAERVAPLTEGERKISWLVIPPFQRPEVWTEEQKVRFIESIWQGLPIGNWCYNRTSVMNSVHDAWLLDGQQRLTAIRDYIAGEFKVLGYLWSELTVIDQRLFSMTPFPCLETNIDDEDKLREVYDRLAYGGTAHEPKPSVDTLTFAAITAISRESKIVMLARKLIMPEGDRLFTGRDIEDHESRRTREWKLAMRRAEMAYDLIVDGAD